MIIGGLSEKELQLITDLLNTEKIPFEVGTDENMMKSNQDSMQHNLRHLNSPSISTHVLALKLEPSAFEQMSESLKKSLLDFGITDQIPEDLIIEDKEVEFVQSEITNGNKRLIGKFFLHTTIYATLSYFLFRWIQSFLES